MDTGRFSHLNLVASWFGVCYLTLIFSALLLFYLSTAHPMTLKHTDFRLYAALPAENIQSTDKVTYQDARSLIIKNFLAQRGSVLAPLSDYFVQVADQYSLDYRLLPAIAMQESNGGRVLPDGSFNPFGYGIYGSQALHFGSWEDGIRTVGQGLRENYLNQGLTTPYEIMTKYTPPSLAKGGPWAIGVSAFMEQLK